VIETIDIIEVVTIQVAECCPECGCGCDGECPPDCC
jgi:hypothetical protein